MSTDLVVPNGLSQTPQAVQDQDGNSSSLLLGVAGNGGTAAGFVGIAGPGGGGATATLALSTYAEIPSLTPNVQLTATDQGDYSATLAFNLQVPGTQGNGPFSTVLQLLPNGGIQMPHLQQPASGTVDLVIDGAGNVSPQNSSVRFKEDVRPLCDDFSKVLLLEPKSFTYKETGARGIGYIAEQVAEADLGELVAFGADGQPLGVHYKMISIYLLELLKDQQAALAEVRAEIATLKASTRCH